MGVSDLVPAGRKRPLATPPVSTNQVNVCPNARARGEPSPPPNPYTHRAPMTLFSGDVGSGVPGEAHLGWDRRSWLGRRD